MGKTTSKESLADKIRRAGGQNVKSEDIEVPGVPKNALGREIKQCLGCKTKSGDPRRFRNLIGFDWCTDCYKVAIEHTIRRLVNNIFDEQKSATDEE